jgi:mannose-6-phosphate isomerase
MKKLYPILFETIFKDKIWGGNKIKSLLGKDYAPLPNCGETWEISGEIENISIVKEGPLKGIDLKTLINLYKEKLLGKRIFEQFNDQFPLLIKFIDANEDLSIQVHPDDAMAGKLHNSFGKTEMWYVLQADKGAKLNAGFNRSVDIKTYLDYLNNRKLSEILNFEEVHEGDVFFLPAGRVHYIGKGICLAEIQQTSDVTYRIYDFDRLDAQGKKRELHTELALKAIDFKHYENYKTGYNEIDNQSTKVVSCKYFTTNIISCTQPMIRDYAQIDSFVIYIFLEGDFVLNYEEQAFQFKKGDCVLIPASLKKLQLSPKGLGKLLEVYIK